MNTNTTTSRHDRSPAICKLRVEYPGIAAMIEEGKTLAVVRDHVDQRFAVGIRPDVHRTLDALDVEIARGDFDDRNVEPHPLDLGPEDNPRDQTAAGVMAIVHEEAEAQNHWDVLGISFTEMSMERGIVRFRHEAGQFGTASFRWYPGVRGDRALFEHGHYGMDWPSSARDFIERITREY